MLKLELPQEIEEVLARMSTATGQSAEQIARRALYEVLEDWEDLQVAEERIRNPEGPSIPLEDVIR